MELMPYRGIGPLLLGMSRGETREAARGPVMEVESPGVMEELGMPQPPTDYFPELDLKVEYDDTGARAIYIEAGMVTDVKYLGQGLFRIPYRALVAQLREADEGIEVEDDGFIAPGVGIAVYAPDGADHPELPCDSISVFEEGYYDEEW